jgi:hypothetical protein
MNGVARLETHDASPAASSKHAPRLRRIVAQFRELGVGGAVDQPHITAQQDFTLPMDTGHTGVSVLDSAVDLAGLALFVVFVLFRQFQDTQDLSAWLDQSDCASPAA